MERAATKILNRNGFSVDGTLINKQRNRAKKRARFDMRDQLLQGWFKPPEAQ